MALAVEVQLVPQLTATASKEEPAPKRVTAVRGPESIQFDSFRRKEDRHIRVLIPDDCGLHQPRIPNHAAPN
ncbi:hypothetical protein [Kitasatospora sp. NPDC004289]